MRSKPEKGPALAGLAAAHRLRGIERKLVTRPESIEGGIEVPRRIGKLRPAAERHAVLDLLADPAVHVGDEGRIVGEHATEIDAVVAAVALHHGRRLDDAHDLRIDL